MAALSRHLAGHPPQQPNSPQLQTLAVALQAKKLEAEVLAPMQRWTTAYNTVQTRMTKLEGLRLEVDSRRSGLNLGRHAPALAAGCMTPGLLNKAANPDWACVGPGSLLVL